MNIEKFDNKEKELIFRPKIRCHVCSEIPIIKEVINGGGISFFINSECLNKHGEFFCALQDYCHDKRQIDKKICHKCQKLQDKVNSKSLLYQVCKECQQFLCSNCYKAHQSKFHNKHHVVNIYELDFLCKEHHSPYIGFCPKCNINICNLCKQRTHSKHEKIILFTNIMPSKEKIRNLSLKIEEQKEQIDELNVILDSFFENVKKAKEYKDNINTNFRLNNQIYNCIDVDNPNYQSILNFDKTIDLDISDISWVTGIQNDLDRFIKFIKSKCSSQKISHNEKKENISKSIIDKELLATFQETIVSNEQKTSLDLIESKLGEKDDDFNDNELLKEIGYKNKKIFKKDEIIGDLKKIYNMDDCNDYLMLADDGLFIYDKDNNDLITYIDINENLEFDEVKALTHYYNKKENKIYLFCGTNTNKIKIYCIDENKEYFYKLIQVLKLENIINIYCNKFGELFILEKDSTSTYNLEDNIYVQNKEYITCENETKNIYPTENYLISTIKEKNNILFYDKNNYTLLFSISNINNDEKTKIFDLSKNLICISFKNKIQVIDTDKKSLCYSYEIQNMNYIENGDVINDKELLLSIDIENKLVMMMLELDNTNKKFNEMKKIEDLQCKLINKISNNKIILYTKYGVNIIGI